MIRKYTEKDLEFLQEQDFVSSLELQYHKDVFPDSAIVSEDEEGNCQGIIYFKKHFTYDGVKEELNRVVVCIYTEKEDCKEELLAYAKKWCKEHAEQYPDKKVCLVNWINASEQDDLQCYLHNGFIEYEACPCLKYDLDNAKDQVEIPQGLTVKKMEFVPEEVDAYIVATTEANDGTSDSANELWFLNGGGTCSIYMLMDGEHIVASASRWKITEERSAIENIFTTPSYRRQGMAKLIIQYTLAEAKKDGFQIGTLGMLGRNIKASRLYQSLGFELYYNQIEMIYLP